MLKQAAAAMCAAACVGCAFGPPRPYLPGEPVVATLPLLQAGLHDERELFARNFAAELAAAGKEPDVHPWLHLRAASGPARDPHGVDARGVSVLVVPGIFGECVADQSLPFGDGEIRAPEAGLSEAYAYLRSAGYENVRAVPVHGRASSGSNATIVASAVSQELQRADVRRVVLVAYSKGVPDTLEALHQLSVAGDLRKAVTLVSVAGVVMGTPLADRFAGVYRTLAARMPLRLCPVSDGGEVASLTQAERIAWLARHPPPANVHLYSIVAHTAAKRMSPGLQPFHELLSRDAPHNDGQVRSSDALLPRSTLLAEANSDHWTFVLPLREHPNLVIRSLAADLPYPRQEFLRALLRTVLELDR